MSYLLNRFSEASTWRGIALFLTAFGVKVRPDLADSIATAGAAVVGTIEILRKEKQG